MFLQLFRHLSFLIRHEPQKRKEKVLCSVEKENEIIIITILFNFTALNLPLSLLENFILDIVKKLQTYLVLLSIIFFFLFYR